MAEFSLQPCKIEQWLLSEVGAPTRRAVMTLIAMGGGTSICEIDG